MKYGYALFLALMGIMFFTFSLNVFENNIAGQFPVAVIFAIISFFAVLLSGIEIGEQKKDKSNYEPANLEDLKVGGPRNFVISQGPFLGDCPRTKDCFVEFFLLDFVNLADNSAGMLLLKLDITDKIALKEALKKISKEEIKQGVEFSIDENHNITKTKL